MGRAGEARPGGTASLAAFLNDHQDAVEADLLRYYRLDLPADLGTDRLTWRRLKVLIEQLPAESCTVRTTRGDTAAWTLEPMLLALIADHLAIGNWQRAMSGRKAAQRTRAPRQIQRPGVREPGERRLGGRPQPVAAMRERLRRLNGR